MRSISSAEFGVRKAELEDLNLSVSFTLQSAIRIPH